MSKKFRLEEDLQAIYAAIQYLQHERSTVDISEELGISRFMVGRMIKRAREDGLIEVVPRLPDPVNTDLSKALTRKYGLDSAVVVVPPADSDDRVRTVVAAIAARLIAELIEEDDIVGLGPGRTIVETCALISEVPTCDVVQLTGVATSDPASHLNAIMQLSSVAKGRMFPLHAPFVTTDLASARTIAAQPPIKQALQRMNRLDKSVLTVGGWPQSSLLATQLDELGELAPLLDQGVAAEIGTTLLDTNGRELHTLDGRLIGLSTEQLSNVPVRVALGGGPGKQLAVLAVLRSGLADIVVTDEHTARIAIEA
ncbi:hypothetical protein J7E29_10510 [Streptomyces sp. ISL-90]|nr:hypothetical protein [Streptomyces sp. ISL-90]